MTIMVATSFMLGVNAAFAAPVNDLDKAVKGTGLQDVENRFHPLSAVDPGADAITSVIFYAIDFLKYLIGGIAILFAITSGVKLITATNKIDEVAEKEKENLKYIIYGLILIIVADQLVSKVFFGDYGECIASASNAEACAKAGGGIIQGVYSFVLAIMATVAVFVLVVASFRLVTSYGNEETIGKEKKRIGMATVGLLLAGTGEFVIKAIVFPKVGKEGIDVLAAQNLVYSLTSFVASFIGIGAALMLVYGGYLYVISAGNDEQTGKAKKIMISALIGIVIAMASYFVVNALITLNPDVRAIGTIKQT
jgi:uncharacterized membrane protein